MVAVIAVAVVLLLRSSSANYYITPGELAEKGNDRSRVAGKIIYNSIEWKQNEQALYFTIKAEGERDKLPVVYKGYAPENLVSESEVIVEGSMNGKLFWADTILVRCPENYLPERMVGAAARGFKFEGTLYR